MEETVNVTEAVEVINNAQQQFQKMTEDPDLFQKWLQNLVPNLFDFAFQILIAIAVYVIGMRLINVLVKMVSRSMEHAGTDAGVRQFVTPLIKYSLTIILIFIIMGFFGIETTSVVAVLGSAGVAVGLALQGSLSNLAGGVLILLLKPFKVGDYIIEDTGKNEGTVVEISIFYTKLLTPDNKMIVVPNGTLSNSSLTNASHMDKRRVDVMVRIPYSADIREVKAVLLQVAEREPTRLLDQDTIVMVDNLGESAVNMGLRIWVPAEEYWNAKWRLMENVKYALDEHGIAIAYPQMDIQIKQ